MTIATALLIAAHVWGTPAWCGQQPAVQWGTPPAIIREPMVQSGPDRESPPTVIADCTIYLDQDASSTERCTAVVHEWGRLLLHQLSDDPKNVMAPDPPMYWRCTTKRGIHGFTARQWHQKPKMWLLQ